MRVLIVTFTSLLLLSSAGEAQQAVQAARVGVLCIAGCPPIKAFEDGLRELGWVDGRNVIVEYRSAEGKSERLPELATELVRLKVSVIVVAGEPMILAARQATSTIPIVMAGAGDPVGRGIVASLARPGGNITGVSNLAVELTGKWLDLLREAIPSLAKVAALRNPANPTHAAFWREAQDAARRLGVQAFGVEAKAVDEIEPAFEAMARERPDGLIVFPDPLFNVSQRMRIARLAEQHRLPSIALFRTSAEAGALMSYGPSSPENYRRAAAYVDKILKGARPAELPVEQARQFELVINAKTARTLGLTIPQSLLLRTDHVIQ